MIPTFIRKKKYKKNALGGILLVIIMMMTTGCVFIATPEELLRPPELNLESKKIKDATDSFTPVGATVMSIANSKYLESSNTLRRIDLDQDGKDEMIFFYKDKVTKIINGMVLREVNDSWVKLAEITIDSLEILRFNVKDLNQDGKMEIVLGYYGEGIYLDKREMQILSLENNTLKPLFTHNYIAMDMGDLDGDNVDEIAILLKNEAKPGNQMMVLKMMEDSFVNASEVLFTPSKNTFSISIGKIYKGQKAIFVDSETETYQGYTDVFVFDGNRLKDFEEMFRYRLDYKKLPIGSEDIDGDGIMEIGLPYYPPDNQGPGEDDYVYSMAAVFEYYRILQDGTLEKAKQIYTDYGLGIEFSIPLIFDKNYDITVNDSSARFTVSFITEDKKKIDILEIDNLPKASWDEIKDQYQMIMETQDMVVAGKLLPEQDNLSQNDAEVYEKMRTDLQNISEVIRPIGY